MKKTSIIKFCFLAFIIGSIARCTNFVPLGNSCTSAKKQVIYSPNKMAYVVMEQSSCGLLQNQYITLEVHHDNTFMPIDVNEGSFSSMDIHRLDIKWPSKPLTTRSHALPRIVWKDDYQVDIYVETYVRFGTDVYDDTISVEKDIKSKLIEKKPFKIIVHYELQDK